MRGSTSAPFPGMIVHPQVCPVCLWSPITEVPQPWFSPLWSYLSCQLVGEAGQEYNARQDIGGGSAVRLFNRILRSWGKWNTPGQLSQQIWHRSGCLVHLKNLLTCHFLFFLVGKNISQYFACLYSHCSPPWQKIWNALAWAVWEFPWHRYEDFPHS